jgi:ribosome biogenesis GTPase A
VRACRFEHNLEVWRQLWRTVEKADIVVMLADCRCPLLHFNESLLRHVREDHRKAAVLVLNKADLVPPSVASSWVHYFEQSYPGLRAIGIS